MARKALLNIARMCETEKDTPIEVSFLLDFEYTCKQLNKYEARYYFKHVTPEKHPTYFNTEKGLNVICVDSLPEPNESNCFEKVGYLYHTNDQKYYACVYSDGKPSRHYKPSSMNCIRNMYYQVSGADLDTQREDSCDSIGICESGTDRHKRIQFVVSQMRKQGVDCDFIPVKDFIEEKSLPLQVLSVEEYETKCFDEKRNIVFLCDGIIKYKGQYLVLEIKTESQYKWTGRQCVDPSHYNQAYTYSLEFGIDKVLFLYENRDLCSKKPYILPVTQENRDYIEDRVSKCTEYVNQRVVPPKETNITAKTCQYCQYRTQCKADSK